MKFENSVGIARSFQSMRSRLFADSEAKLPGKAPGGSVTITDQSQLLSQYAHDARSISGEIETLALLSDQDIETVEILNELTQMHPSAKLYWLRVLSENVQPLTTLSDRVSIFEIKKPQDVHTYLQGLKRIDVIIENGTRFKSLSIPGLDETVFYLRQGGLYASLSPESSFVSRHRTRDASYSLSATLAQILRLKSKSTPFASPEGEANGLKELSLAVDGIVWNADTISVQKGQTHLYKLREHEATKTLNARYGSAWGTADVVHAGGSFESLARVVTNRRGHSDRFVGNLTHPALSVRTYKGATVRQGQVAAFDTMLLPDTFRHLLGKQLKNRNIPFTSDRFGRLPVLETDAGDRFLPGYYYYLDTEHPNVYGHIPTEVVSRLWAWREAKRSHPELRALVAAQPGHDDIPGYERQILRAFGIRDGDVEVFHGQVQVENLLAATPMFSNPKYVVPAIQEIWAELREGLRERSTSSSDRVFLTRPPGSVRQCRNSAQVEKVFSSYGFEIVSPELLPLGKQVELFASCKVIAGYGGSAMLNGIFSSGPSTRIVISSDTYTAANEYLISSIFGDDLHYYWCNADVQRSEGRRKAFASSFAFDFDADGKRLIELLDTLA